MTDPAGAALAQWPLPSHAPVLHGVPSIAGAHWPELGAHCVERHSAPPQLGVPAQAPAWQVSELAKTQRFPSAHGAPFATAGVEHWPLVGSHAPAAWHASAAVQTTGFEPAQAPLAQVSVCVQASPSLQGVPSEADGFEQTPLDGSHVPAR